MQIFCRGLDSRTSTLTVQPDDLVFDVKSCVQARLGVPAGLQLLAYAGRHLDDARRLSDYSIEQDATVHLVLRLRGGKGGFGALLRGAGRAALTDNFDACRDLSGRRLRHANAEQKLREWAKQSKELKQHLAELKRTKEEEKIAKRQASTEEELDKVKAAQRTALAGVMAALQDGLVDSGLVSTTAGSSKRAAEDAAGSTQPAAKRARFDLDSLELSGSDMSSDDDFDLSSEDEDAPLQDQGSADDKDSNKAQQAQQDAAASQAGDDHAAETDTLVDGVMTEAALPEDQRLPLDQPVILTGQGNDVVAQLDLAQFGSASDLEAVGLEKIKYELQTRGLKCGGTLSDRATRLFLLKTQPLDALDPKHFAKGTRK